MLQVDRLSIHFADREEVQEVVRGISFSVQDGEIVGIVGESGSGKTMTALTIAGLFKEHAVLDAGTIRLDGTDLLKLTEREMRQVQGNRIGMIFQEPMTALNPTMKIGRQVEEALRLHTDLDSRARKAAVIRALEEVELDEAEKLLSKYPHELSGGMRQRVMIAAAMICRPSLLIADEPTTALDVTIQAQIMNLLKELQQETGMAMILITHDIGVVANMADRVLVMYAGQMIERAPSKELFHHPAHPYTQALLDTVPTIRDDADRQLVSIPGIVPESYDDITGCRFADRCAYACPRCEQPQEDYVMGAEHTARCIVMKNRWERADESEKQKSQRPETSVCEEKGGSAGE